MDQRQQPLLEMWAVTLSEKLHPEKALSPV